LTWKAYPSYKTSGVEWLGKIPAHWNVTTLKRIGELQAGAGFPDDEQGISTEEIPFFKVGDMGSPGNERDMMECANTISESTARRLRAFVFPLMTIVFAKVGAALKINRRRLLMRRSCIDNNMMGFMPTACDPIWAFYWLIGLDMGELANPGAVPSVNEGQMRGIPAVVPPRQEQYEIAAFLDRETAKIDTLIAKKEGLIELLHEKRTALITQAVTKGLDPNAPMKDSGVECLGKIPAHWQATRLKRVASIRYGLGEPPEQLSDGLPFIRATNITKGRIVAYEMQFVDPKDVPWNRDPVLQSGDIIVVRSGAYTGDSAIIPPEYDGAIAGYDMVVRPRPGSAARFLAWALLSRYVLEVQIELESSRAAQPHLNAEELGAVLVLLPLESEQHRIAAFLDRETAKIDALATKINEAIARLKEYRTALISAAVTGKIDLRKNQGSLNKQK
jgi:type I restriction enzyme S subunit